MKVWTRESAQAAETPADILASSRGVTVASVKRSAYRVRINDRAVAVGKTPEARPAERQGSRRRLRRRADLS